MTARHILIADDDHNILVALKMLLSSEGFEVTMASKPAQVSQLVSEQNFDAVLLDLNFELDTTSGEEGLALIEQIYQLDNQLPIIVMTGWATVELAVTAMQKGARDFIQKPWENERLLAIVKAQLTIAEQQQKTARLTQENQLLKAASLDNQTMIAQSPAMKRVITTIEQVASSDVSILITGENGTGKSLLAEYIHQISTRHQHSLIQVNMGAISEGLFESEMFGHVKGAFTDARENRIGRFELADQGSLFLDEIGNIPSSQQAKLLRVLESQQFERVGASKTQQVDVRVISATNANMSELITTGEFRQDLLYRLNSMEIRLPALRERIEDILPLAEFYLNKFAQKYHKSALSFNDDATKALLSYSWPGNIRELNHIIERAVLLCQGNEITCEVLSLSANDLETTDDTFDDTCNVNEFAQPLETLEKAIIARRIAHFRGNMMDAAKSLGLSRSAFYRRIDKYDL